MQTYQKKNHTPAAPGRTTESPSRTASPPMDALLSGLAQPSPRQLGQPVDLPDQMRAKMERAFGADFSGVQLYRSQAVADAGAQAVAQGNRIAVAPDRLDFSSARGQALLGHELSHVAAQARGEVRGQGFLHDAALESRADQEGVMAARGESFGPAVGSLSSASAANAAGPMQAKKDDEPLPSMEGIAPDVYDRAEDKGINWVGGGETAVDYYTAVAKQLDPRKLKKAAKFLREAPVLKDPADQAASLIEKATSSKESQRFGTATSIIGTANSAYGAAKAIFGKNEGDSMDRAVNITKGVIDLGVSSMDTASRFTSAIAEKAVTQASSIKEIVKGSIDLANAGRHGFMASTDNIMAQNAVHRIRNESADRTSQEQQANDRTAESLFNAQQRTAGIHKKEAVKEGIHAGLDITNGAVRFIPGAGTAAGIGVSILQAITDSVAKGKIDRRRKVEREANLGQDRMDMLRTLTERLIAERRAQCAESGRSFTMFDKDECQKLAKHTVNQKLFGNGARTNRMAGLQKTNAEVTAMEQLMQNRDTDAEGERTAGLMTTAGHAIGNDGSFVDRNESLAMFNADFSGKSFEDTYRAAAAKEDKKYHLVQVARSNARKKAEKATAENAEEAHTDAAGVDQELLNGARATQKQSRKGAREKYRENQNRYVAEEMAREENQGLGSFRRKIQEYRLKKEFDRDSRVRGIENAAEGTISAGRRGSIKRMLLRARRSHDRARDSIVNDGFDELGLFERFKIAVANPLAWIASKTDSGRAKSDPNRRISSEQHSAALLDEIMGSGNTPEPAPDVPESAAGGDQMPDPSLMSLQDRIDLLELRSRQH